jgi:DNA modification methylase
MNIIEFGDCRETMRKWAQQGIKAQTCVTSPPYFGLRDYGHDGQIGMEETPDEYIAQMVEVFRCVRNVLADDGTVWLNIGDSYCNSNGFARASPEYQREGRNNMPANDRKLDKLHATGLKTKDLIGIPWMLAFALRADGWYLRQDIIWHKPNPMPESVQDRCTKAHEYIFLLSKSQKYYYDRMAISEPAAYAEQHANKTTSWGNKKKDAGVKNNLEQYQQTGIENNKTCLQGGMANKRSVWSVPVKGYDGAHFAVFPQELIEPCIMAGAPVGGLVLDPFMGSGTTAQVAQNLGRKYLGCELNPDYKPLQDKRLRQQSLELA